jgi:hypothetical protein
MRVAALCLVGLVSWIGCGGGGGGSAGGDSVSAGAGTGAGASHTCLDEDGDGFGKYCVAGADCNDADPTVTDECRRCATPTQGWPCEPGAKPMRCDPHYSQTTTMNGQTGTLVCSEGSRYCRDSVYSGCEVLLGYATFIPNN